MKHYNNDSVIAKERLKVMFETNPFDSSLSSATRMKEELFHLLSRYYDLSEEQYDIKIVIKPKKRA